MENLKHTEGNWTFKPSGNANFYFLQVESKPNTWLMNIQQNGELSNEEQIANVNLIVASPELLEALIEINDFVERMVNSKMISPLAGKTIRNRAINAINKATK
jgi:hypothetical protein